ncbi:dTDP-4-dehydrorhamnose 3,5-epimerase family protein [Elioraea sp.]|jgi:dTDP-4-dehydrorhamnose 3,5-epimerase|uniref:dTDP-4-dehydrorhamnose 3,5-epimerase family protein n=1 Tax=Elioraea sp. TaxID=2185103 RepID=UPI003F6EBE99
MTLFFNATALPGVLVVSGADGTGAGPEPLFTAEAGMRAGLSDRLARAELWQLPARGSLRGLHLDSGQVLLRCVQGRAWAVAVDLRAESPAFRHSVGIELAAAGGHGLVVPVGCAHGFVTLAECCSVLRLAAADGPRRGLRWDDPVLAVPWPVAPTELSPAELGFPGFVPPR